MALRVPVLLILAGVAMTASKASANALLQSSAPARLRGQTVSLFMLAMRGGMALGSLVTGASVHLLGVRQALLLNGVMAVLMHLAIGHAWLKVPLRRSKPEECLLSRRARPWRPWNSAQKAINPA
jgi:MFS-type transporter involved in bile tolerance (Atg22 family)